MGEISSEQIAKRKAQLAWAKKLTVIVVPAVIFFGILIVVFFDAQAVVISFGFIIIAFLLLIFTIGSGRRKRQYHHRPESHYNGRLSGVGGISGPSPSSFGSAPGGGHRGPASPYTTTEGYQDLVNSYNEPKGFWNFYNENFKPRNNNSNTNNQHQQSKLGEGISNTALIGLLLAAAIFMWLFG